MEDRDLLKPENSEFENIMGNINEENRNAEQPCGEEISVTAKSDESIKFDGNRTSGENTESDEKSESDGSTVYNEDTESDDNNARNEDTESDENQEETDDINKNDDDRDFVKEILDIIHSDKSDDEIKTELDEYHENDIATAFTELSPSERVKMYRILGTEKVSEIFAYIDDFSLYVDELGYENAADVIENMDADDAVDVLQEIDDDETREQIMSLMEPEATEDIKLIGSYDDDRIGSMMTTNYISISKNSTIKQAMRELVTQAGENDNINTIYVYDEDNKYYGAIDLRDLIIARKDDLLESVISTGYPCISADEKISDSIEDLKSYAEDSLPVVDEENHIIGVITSTDIIEAVDAEMGEDYAKFAAMTEETDINETVFQSMRKRLPWLILLLFLAMGVSSVVGLFESVVKEVAVIVSFQSLILGMAGNVGTQSLAVTIRVLVDTDLKGRDKMNFIFKEMKIGAANGLLLGLLALAFVSFYLHLAKNMSFGYSIAVAVCVCLSLFFAMIISSFVGAFIPMLLHKLKFDPAVASGPLITTMNDLVAVVTYYGLAGLLLVKLLGL